MKKLLSSLLAVALIACATVASANAAGTITAKEQEIITALEKNGVPSEYVAQAKTYLVENEVSDVKVNKLIEGIDEVKAMCEAEGIKSVEQLKNASADFHSKFVAKVNAVASVIGVTISVSADGSIKAVDASGNVIGEVKAGSSVTNQTGFAVDSAIATLAGLVAVVAVCGAVASKKKLFA